MANDPEESHRSDGSAEDSEPSWVSRLCELPLRFRSERDVSILWLFRQASPDLGDPRFENLIERHLEDRPDLVQAWQIYSSDKRVNRGPYLDGTEVGDFEVGKGTSDVRLHDNPLTACADFIHREAKSIAG